MDIKTAINEIKLSEPLHLLTIQLAKKGSSKTFAQNKITADCVEKELILTINNNKPIKITIIDEGVVSVKNLQKFDDNKSLTHITISTPLPFSYKEKITNHFENKGIVCVCVRN
jgi:hypothetical protein